MTEPTCPLCQATRHERLFRVGEHDLLSCDQCDLIYIWPYPQDSGDVYESVSDYNYDHLEILSAKSHFRSSKLAYSRMYPQIRPYYEGAKAALDVGCGSGFLLKQLGEDFPAMDRLGIELNRTRAEFTRDIAKCKVLEVPVQQLDVDTTFDVITMIAVFSHAPDFDGFYNKLRDLLADKGKLIMHVGEFSRDVQPNAVFDWEIPDHLQFMGLKTAEVLAEKYGLRIVERRREPIEDLIFAKTTWRAPGRSRMRNAIKGLVVHTPFALSLLKKLYTAKHGGSVYNSIIVFERL